MLLAALLTSGCQTITVQEQGGDVVVDTTPSDEGGVGDSLLPDVPIGDAATPDADASPPMDAGGDADGGPGEVDGGGCQTAADCQGAVTPGACEIVDCVAGVCAAVADPAQVDQPCDDGDPCSASVCGADGSCSGPALDCDDGVTCTVDSCDPASGGCVNDTSGCDVTVSPRQIMMSIVGASSAGDVQVRSVGRATATVGTSSGGDITVRPAVVRVLSGGAP